MTQATIGGVRYTMSMEMKARLLEVIDIHEAGVLAVRSGSDSTKAYAVQHNGTHAHYCPCKSHGACSHKIAVDRYLQKQNEMDAYREAYPNDFYFAA